MTTRWQKAKRWIGNHALPVFFVLGTLLIAYQLFSVNHYFWRDFNPHWRQQAGAVELLSIALNNLADALLLMLPLLLWPRRRRWLQWVIIWLVSAWCLCQLLYHPNYLDLMPFSSFLLVQNLSGMVVKSAWGSLQTGHLPVVVLPMLLYAVYRLLLACPLRQAAAPHRGWWAAGIALAFAALRVVNPVCLCPSPDLRGNFAQRLAGNYTVVPGHHDYYFRNNGLVSLGVYSLAQTLIDLRGLSDDDKREIDRFLEQSPRYTDNRFAAGRPNLVLLIVESLNSWAVGMEIDGTPVTPNLNALVADTAHNIVGLHMKRQAKNGHSSDGHFIYNTGLLPLTDQVVAMAYGDTDYPSLAKAMPGRHAVQITNDYPSLWNLHTTSHSYGFGTLLCKDTVKTCYEQNDWLVDQALCSFSLQVLPTLPQPFYVQIVTQCMHSPYDNPEVPVTAISRSTKYTPQVRNYLERTAFFDRQLGRFLDSLRRSPLYDSTLIVIVSDHNDMVDFDPAGRPSIDPEGDDCVFIAVNAGQGFLQREVFGQIDVFPTLLDLMGANQYQWKGLGNSLLRRHVTSAATAPGETKGDRAAPLAPRQQQAWSISRDIIKGRYLPRP